RLAAIVGAEDVRAQVVDAQRVDGGVGGEGVEVAGVENGDLHPGSDGGRGDVFPVEAAIGGDVDQAIVGAGPDAIDVGGRGGDGVDDALLRRLGGRLIAVLADAGGNLPGLARQVG